MLLDDCYIGYLNMDHRIDRLNHMSEQFLKSGINTAVRHRGKKPEEFNLRDRRLKVMRDRTKGAIPCHFGQVEIMVTALGNHKHACVFEDDIFFCDDFNERMEYISEWTKTHEFDIIWLGAPFHTNPPYWHPTGNSKGTPNCSAGIGFDAEPTDDLRMVRTYGAYCTFAYIVNKNSVEKVLKMLDKNLHKSIGIDWLMLLIQPQLKCYSFVPGCVKQIDNLSDIGTGMTVWSGQLRNGPYVYQNFMHEFNPEGFKWK